MHLFTRSFKSKKDLSMSLMVFEKGAKAYLLNEVSESLELLLEGRRWSLHPLVILVLQIHTHAHTHGLSDTALLFLVSIVIIRSFKERITLC